MNFKKYIEDLKNTPKHKANSVAFTGAIIGTALIFGVWYLTLGPRLDAIADEANGNGTSKNIISGLKDNVASALDGFDSIKNEVKNVPNVVAGSDNAIPTVELESIK